MPLCASAPRRALVCIVGLAAALAGCTSRETDPGSDSGMTTVLEPGTHLRVAASGPSPSVQVLNHGPGTVVVEGQGIGGSRVVLADRGYTEVSAVRAVVVTNASESSAEVEVRVIGAEHVDIFGPARR